MAEENYEELLNSYMDDLGKYIESEENNEIVNVDHESPFSIEDAISIDTYVNEKLGLVADCSELWHSGLRDLKSTTNSPVFDYMIGISNDIANQYPEYVKEGYFLLVIDHHGNGKRATYINPDKIRYALTEKSKLQQLQELSKTGCQNLAVLDIYMNAYRTLLLEIAEIEKIKAVIRIARKNLTYEQLEQNEERRGNTL